MLTKFWETAGGKLGDRWLMTAFPALLFWFGGCLAWVHGSMGWSILDTSLRRLTASPAVVQGLMLVGALVVVSGSALVVGQLTEPMLHVVEGYWPLWALRFWDRIFSPGQDRDEEFQKLHKRIAEEDPKLAPADFAEYLRLDRRQRRQPALPHRRLPTRVGNILRTAESTPLDKYGLDSVVVWPRLWLLLPDTARAELGAARQAMTSSVAAAQWGLLFTVFGIFTPWAVPIGISVTVIALWGWLPGRARTFGDLLEAAFDLYRVRLYEHLRWPLPENPDQERRVGTEMTKYLWRGSDAKEPTFVLPPQ